MSIRTKTEKAVVIKLPLTGLKFLYRSNHGKKLVLEVDIDSLKKINEPDTIDEMVAEARLEYFAGRTKGFTDTKKLMAYLES